MIEVTDSRGAYLEQVAEIVGRIHGLSERAQTVVAAARRHAESVIAAGGGTPDATHAGLVTFVADVLNGLWLEHEWLPSDVESLFDGIAEVTGLPRDYVATSVALRALGHQSAFDLPPRSAIEAQLGMLFSFAPVTAVSLWTREPGGPLRCVIHHGPAPPSRQMRTLALRALAGEEVTRVLQAVPVMRWDEPRAALVARAAPGGRWQCRACLEEAAGTLGPLLERQAILEQSAERDQFLLERSERALVRLGFDLHDGPIQDLAALGLELHSFRRQLAGALPPEARERALLIGRVDDIHARLVSLDASVRELSQSLDAPALGKLPVQEALSVELDTFRTASGISADVSVKGDVDGLTASQRIALLRIVHEALTNVRHHSGASQVTVTVAAKQGHVRATIEDNGRGFDPERTLAQASRRGRLGLLGMAERARLLGGSCQIRSASGGPTTVALALPRWDPPSSHGSAAPVRGTHAEASGSRRAGDAGLERGREP